MIKYKAYVIINGNLQKAKTWFHRLKESYNDLQDLLDDIENYKLNKFQRSQEVQFIILEYSNGNSRIVQIKEMYYQQEI